VTVYFTSPDSRLRPGLTAHAEIQTADKPHALSIPIAAVTGTGTSASVMKLVGGTPTRTHVTLGIQSADGYVEVTSGLSEGDTILVDDTKQYRIVPN
jgi:macrolide-specific efflux system membrane fusion protein